MEAYENTMNKKSDLQLIKIIEYDFADYNQDALVAARQTLDLRNFDAAKLQELRDSIDLSLHEKVNKQKKINETVDRGSTIFSKILDSFNPITPKKNSTFLKLIAAYLSFMVLMSLYENYNVFYPEYVDFYSLEVLTTILILCVSIYGILAKQRIGWVVLVCFLSFHFSSHFVGLIDGFRALIHEFTSPPRASYESDQTGLITLIESMQIQYNPTQLIGQALGGLLVSGAIVWFLCKPNIRRLYKISVETRNKVIFVGAFIGLVIWGTLYWRF